MIKQCGNGFTLLELLSCMAVFVILVFFSFPNTFLYKKEQLETLAQDIKKAVQIAKLQSIITGECLILAPLSEKTWSEGIVLIKDNAKHSYTPGTALIQEWKWLRPGVHVSWHGIQSEKYMLFSADLKSSMTNGYFLIRNNLQQIKLVVNRLGRVRQG